jgi:8-oxo-dGTP pyrophosphatase MutT (NUDIX family)
MSRRPPILEPRAVPVVGADTHLPPLSGERLAEDFLRERFRRPPAWQVELPGDAAVPLLAEGRPPSPASVLVPLVRHPDGLRVLLTRRTAHLKAHAGQISFPGGRAEPHDPDVTATALREAEEEVGLPPAEVEVLGHLPVYTTVTNFVVTPVVGIIRPGLSLRPDPQEVDEVFEVPLAFLMSPANHQRHRFEHDGQSRQFLSMPWRPQPGSEYFIWGATAAMLRNFYRFLSA